MALSFSRWLAITVFGFGIALVVLLTEPRPAGDSEVSRPAERERASRARRHVGVAAERLRVLWLVDSVRTAMGQPRSQQSRVAIARDVQPRTRRAVETLIAQLAADRPTTPVVAVDLAVVADTVSSIRGVARSDRDGFLLADYVLPRPNSADRCLVLARTKYVSEANTEPFRIYARLLGEQSRQSLLGPCAFYERFGHPGPQLDRWVRDKGWSIGLRSALGEPSRPWRSRYRSQSPEDIAQVTNWTLRYAMSPRGFACVVGDLDACDRAILDARESNSLVRQKARIWSTGIVSTGEGIELDREGWWWQPSRDLGPRDVTILAEMVRTLGPERFQRFWSSSQAPDEAFHAAAGTDIGRWTHEWSRRTYGEHARGPGLRAYSALGSVAFIVGAVLVAAFASRRRQVA